MSCYSGLGFRVRVNGACLAIQVRGKGLRLRVWGLGSMGRVFLFWLGFWVLGLGFGVDGACLAIQVRGKGLGLRVESLGLRLISMGCVLLFSFTD